MQLFNIIVGFATTAASVTALGAIPFSELYPAALKGKVTGTPREYQPHEAAFDEQCKNVRIVGQGVDGQTRLQGVCKDRWQRDWLTELNLNRCLTIVGGKFAYYAWSDQTFDDTCYDCKLFHADSDDQLMFACACLDANCDLQPISAQLGGMSLFNYYLQAAEGRFLCGNERGTKELVTNRSIAKGWLRQPE
ncbi:hypothetical protein EDB81DRAFT_754330 [Dactylonectria macrodidyma]|uniref:Cyanovirin-N domain-containing protein n=1 Tax=Dactylonectria macrodidyma TaxID=307937 RepID=A0A9P9FND0_9HYPO|nr:hypothetical protein EDB81DRAFT_754330 [Dactylonectria macrodidyma]